MLVLYPGLDGLLDLINPHISSVLVIAGKDSLIISFLFDDKTIPFFLQKPRFIFLVKKFNTSDLLKTEMVLFLVSF